MKAASSIENAFNALYNSDEGYSRTTFLSSVNPNWIIDFMQYFNINEYITTENAKKVCSGYDKLPAGDSVNTRDPDFNAEYMCSQDGVGINITSEKQAYGFITTLGMLVVLGGDWGDGCGYLLDTNGPNKGPNLFGRDLFEFYPRASCLFPNSYNLWGDTNSKNECETERSFCGLKLLQEGKMNY